MNENTNFPEFYRFEPSKGTHLPGIGSSARIAMRLHRCLGLQIIKKIVCYFLKIPKGIDIQPGFFCHANNLKFDGPAFLGDTHFVDYAPIIIGRNAMFSFNNKLITSTHTLDNFGEIIARPIIIGEDAWVTSNVTILGGVTIGRGSVIGAGSVVTKSIPDFCFAAGNPCKPIKNIKRASSSQA